jgi:pimeloyl-ACP methyl ester carboxylesterase
MIDVPETRYAKTDDGVHIAYQVVGDGPTTVVFANSFMGHIEVSWEYPRAARFYERMASFCRLVIFDRRGTGLSDPLVGEFSLEDRSEDLRAVMNALALDRPVLLGSSEGGVACAYMAAMHPDRVSGLVLFSAPVVAVADERAPWAWTGELRQAILDSLDETWSDPSGASAAVINPSLQDDADARAWYARYFRQSASPALVRTLMERNMDIDIRTLLPAIRVPTLIMHRTDETWINVGQARYAAEVIAGARLVELPGTDHYIWEQNMAAVVDEIEEFVTGVRSHRDVQRPLLTVVFTDIVGSTNLARELGDDQWRTILDRHEALVRRQVARFDGTFVKSTGDGVVATFDGPARAIRCCLAIREAVRGLGLLVRIGVHTGEVDLRGNDIGGITVHTAARIEAMAADNEVVVSRTVADLVAGSGIGFTDRGNHELKGVPGTWQLYLVEG